MSFHELLIGCGASREKRLSLGASSTWHELTTWDINPACNPDRVWDLEKLPYPSPDDFWDEIHAYCVLEHTGAQGDWQFFFAQFAEFWRILKPNGLFLGISPRYDSAWAWGDPGHKRIIGLEQLTFLHQPEYAAQVGKSSMTDYRSFWKLSFKLIVYQPLAGDDQYGFVLRKEDAGCSTAPGN